MPGMPVMPVMNIPTARARGSIVKPLIKICGLTRPDDAHLAVALGATHIGAVRTESSPRWVSAARARDIFAAAEGKAETVFVFRDIPLRQVIEDANVSGARGVQLYDASDDDVRALTSEGYRVYRVYRMEHDASSLPRFEPLPDRGSACITRRRRWRIGAAFRLDTLG